MIMYDGAKERVIEPAMMSFQFDFAVGECHEKHTGICSLERKRAYRKKDIRDRCDYDVCPNILKSILERGFQTRMPIEFIEYRCGHYGGFVDGRHRTCIAQKKGMKIPVIVIPQNEDCDLCDPKPHNEDVEVIEVSFADIDEDFIDSDQQPLLITIEQITKK